MRVGVSSRGRWWISMGPLGWLLFGWVYLGALAAVAVALVVWFILRTLWELLLLLGVLVAWLFRPAGRRLGEWARRA